LIFGVGVGWVLWWGVGVGRGVCGGARWWGGAVLLVLGAVGCWGRCWRGGGGVCCACVLGFGEGVWGLCGVLVVGVLWGGWWFCSLGGGVGVGFGCCGWEWGVLVVWGGGGVTGFCVGGGVGGGLVLCLGVVLGGWWVGGGRE